MVHLSAAQRLKGKETVGGHSSYFTPGPEEEERGRNLPFTQRLNQMGNDLYSYIYIYIYIKKKKHVKELSCQKLRIYIIIYMGGGREGGVGRRSRRRQNLVTVFYSRLLSVFRKCNPTD